MKKKVSKHCFKTLVFLLLVLWSCTETGNVVDVEEENARMEILMLFEVYKKRVMERDVEGHSALYSEDLIWAAPNRPVARTKNEMQVVVKESFNSADYDFQLEAEELEIMGNYAYLLLGGSVKISAKSSQDTVLYEPATLMIMRKEGVEWKIYRQVHNFRKFNL